MFCYILAGRHHKHKGVRKDDQPKVPRSLFDRGSFAALRRDNKPLKIKPGYARPPFHKVLDLHANNNLAYFRPLQCFILCMLRQIVCERKVWWHILNCSLLQPTQPIMNRSLMDASSDSPEWLIHEDWALLQCIQSLQELPLQLMTNSPAHIPNWDLVADVVNASSRTYR